MDNKAYIIGTGSYLPKDIVTNEDVARLTGLTPHEIKKMTGILQRRRADKGEATSDLAMRRLWQPLNLQDCLWRTWD